MLVKLHSFWAFHCLLHLMSCWPCFRLKRESTTKSRPIDTGERIGFSSRRTGTIGGRSVALDYTGVYRDEAYLEEGKRITNVRLLFAAANRTEWQVNRMTVNRSYLPSFFGMRHQEQQWQSWGEKFHCVIWNDVSMEKLEVYDFQFVCSNCSVCSN
jgi:hypothetical protein